MIHYLYIGHFEHECGFVKFEKKTDIKPIWHRPVVSRPLDTSLIDRLLRRHGITASTIPDHWGLSIESEGFLSCDRFTRSDEAIEFIKELAQQTGSEIADYSSLSFVSPAGLSIAKLKEERVG